MSDSDLTVIDYRWRGLDWESRKRLIMASVSSQIGHILEDNPGIMEVIEGKVDRYDSWIALIGDDPTLNVVFNLDLGCLTLREAIIISEKAKKAVVARVIDFYNANR